MRILIVFRFLSRLNLTLSRYYLLIIVMAMNRTTFAYLLGISEDLNITMLEALAI